MSLRNHTDTNCAMSKRKRKRPLTNFYAFTESGWDWKPSELKPMCVVRHDLPAPQEKKVTDSRPRCDCGSLLLPDIAAIVEDSTKCLSCNRKNDE